MLILVILGVILLGAGVVLLVSSTSSSGGNTVGQIESYGFSAPTGGDPNAPSQRAFGALASSLGSVTQRAMGTGEQGIRRQLLAAGMYDVEPATIVGYRVLAAVVGAALGLWLTAGAGKPIIIILLGTVALAGLGWALPVFYLSRKARMRTEQIEYELPELIDLLVVTLEAGLSFLASLQMASQRLEGPLGDELRLAMQEQRMGLTANDALQGILRRAETPALRAFVRSVLQGETLGVSTGAIMRNLALEMRKRTARGGRGARAEGARQDALPSDLPHLPGALRRAARTRRLLDSEGSRLGIGMRRPAGEVVLRREADGRSCLRTVRGRGHATRGACAGLLGRPRLFPGSGIVMRPGWSIHTAFMRFPIDVLFVDANQVVLRVVPSLKPWRAALCRGSHDVVELAEGEMRAARPRGRRSRHVGAAKAAGGRPWHSRTRIEPGPRRTAGPPVSSSAQPTIASCGSRASF